MAHKFTRRELLKDAGAAGAASFLGTGPVSSALAQNGQTSNPIDQLLAQPSTALLAQHEDYQLELIAGDMIVGFDRRYGSVSLIKRKGDPFGTNYIGNERNTPGVDPSDSRWTGDVVSTVWELLSEWKVPKLGQNDIFKVSGKWKRELTGKSSDIRRVSFRNGVFTVDYDPQSMNEGGIRSYKLAMSYHAAQDNSLLWDIEIENVTNNVLEFGELGLPLMLNDDYSELYFEPGGEPALSAINNVDYARTPLRQKLIHEQKVLVHHFIAGHSSYVLVQRPLGDPPFLLIHPMMDTSFECLYKDADSKFIADAEGWRGPEILAIHSRATKQLRRWSKNPWVNGHTSLVLQPGEKKSFQVRFAFIDSYEAIRDEVYKAGNLGIRVVPSMVVQEETDVWVELKSKTDIEKIKFLSDNIKIKAKKREGDKTLLTLSFKGRGQKSLKFHYGAGRWTNLHFYCIEDIERLLKARGQFVVERQFYQDPEDPYHRYQGFLPFDHRIGSTFLDSDEVWEVGDSDESGFSEPLFLAQKNVYLPSKNEIDTLETYVADCLFKYIQDPETYAVRASLYWKDRYPSSLWGDWTEQRSEATFRTYNYVHPAVIYHALYRIGKQYGLLTRKRPDEYLRMAYRTCMKWFTTGPWRHIGLMEGSIAIDILEDIKRQGWQQEYNNLLDQMKECEEQFVRDPYPYSSELIIDQTAHQQVYFFTRFFGDTAKNLKTVQVIKALRGGNQPVWFRYGNDKRGDVACWYTESLNGMALLKAFEDSGDLDAFIKGYAGVMSVMSNVFLDGMGFNFFICTAGIYDHTPPRTFESGTGLWGFLKSAKSYVLSDEAFGLIGCGCKVEVTGQAITVYPQDGLKKRVRLVDEKIDLEATQAELNRLVWDKPHKALELEMGDSTGLVKTAAVVIQGLEKAEYKVSYGRSSKRVSSDGTVTLEVPISEARRIRVEQA